MNNFITCDIETYSDQDIKNGVYRYVDTPAFEIQLLSYAFGVDGEIVRVDLANGELIPQEFIDALFDDSIEKRAYNASFERVCLSKYLGVQLSPKSWWCSMTHAAICGLPGSLKDVAKVLRLSEQKDASGTALINYFAKPCKPTASNGYRTKNQPSDAPDRWERYKAYNAQDTVTERAIDIYLEAHFPPIPEAEKENYRINELVNDTGVMIDRELCESIVNYNARYLSELVEESKRLTGLDNPNSLSQLKQWLLVRGVECESITKDTIPDLINRTNDTVVKRVLQIRQNMSKTSTTKYQRMLDAMCSDGRVHGVMKFYGANRTGRWAGRIIQTQNLPRNSMAELDSVRTLVKQGAWDYLEAMYDDITDVFKQLIRTAIVAPEGFVFGIADYSAIEARVIAYLAHERASEEIFHGSGKIYESTAAGMFNVDISTIVHGHENYALRQRGKVATLACGYGGGANAMARMDTAHKIPEEEYPGLVAKWRAANPNIVAFWARVETAVKTAIAGRTSVRLENLVFTYKWWQTENRGDLLITLPSGRFLTYINTSIVGQNIQYDGVTDKGWQSNKTYGGKLVENIVQAFARDCIADSIVKLHKDGFRIVFHVHDEIITEIPEDCADERLKRQTELMTLPNGTWDMPFNGGLSLYHPAPGFTTKYYKKD